MENSKRQVLYKGRPHKKRKKSSRHQRKSPFRWYTIAKLGTREKIIKSSMKTHKYQSRANLQNTRKTGLDAKKWPKMSWQQVKLLWENQESHTGSIFQKPRLDFRIGHCVLLGRSRCRRRGQRRGGRSQAVRPSFVFFSSRFTDASLSVAGFYGAARVIPPSPSRSAGAGLGRYHAQPSP